jgi:hypothetical protein
MSKDKIADYDGTTAGNNTDIGGISIAEGMLPSAVNNSMRELTKQLGAFANGTDAIDALDVTGAATVGGAFTSPGIDDNANATAITIDSSENVGIGVTSMSAKTVINQPSSSDALIIQRAAGVSGNTTFSFPSANSQIAGTNHIILSAGGSERLRIRDSGGITFNGDTAAANALDDYEEGTWTPVDASSGNLTIQVQAARYRKIGSIVQVQAFIIYPTTSDGSNTAIGGLPFSSPSTSNLYGGFTVGYTTYSGSPFTILKNVDDATFSFRVFGGTLLTNNQLSTRDIIFAGTYISV